jgi:cation transport ATPase
VADVGISVEPAVDVAGERAEIILLNRDLNAQRNILRYGVRKGIGLTQIKINSEQVG